MEQFLQNFIGITYDPGTNNVGGKAHLAPVGVGWVEVAFRKHLKTTIISAE